MSEVIRYPVAHQSMWEAFADKDYRDAYAEGHVGDFLASQIHSMRILRGWSQADLARRADATQPMICNWENSCEGVRLTSLHKLASAFDVALMVKFVPFSCLAKEAIGARADLPIPPYDDESLEAIGYGTFRVLPPEPRARPENLGYFKLGPQLMGEQSAIALAE